MSGGRAASEHNRLNIPASKRGDEQPSERPSKCERQSAARGKGQLGSAMAWVCMLRRDFEGRVRVGLPAIRARESRAISATQRHTRANTGCSFLARDGTPAPASFALPENVRAGTAGSCHLVAGKTAVPYDCLCNGGLPLFLSRSPATCHLHSAASL